MTPARVARTRDEARLGYDRLAGVYDLLAGASERPFRERALALLDARPGERVLEIGCGTGEAAVALARAGAVVTAVDLSPRMLDRTRQRLAAAGLSATLVEADGHALPVEAASQDAVFMSFVLDLVDTPDLPAFLAGCRRALRPGGRMVVAAMEAGGGNPVAMRLYAWAHRVFPVLVDCRPLPLRETLEAGGFAVERLEAGTMWGLGVAWALAR